MSAFSSPLRAAPAAGAARMLRDVAPNDAADLPDGVARGLFVGVAGDLRVVDPSGAAVTLISGPSQYHPVEARRILATGTTADAIVALY